jgi:hypothetical protein
VTGAPRKCARAYTEIPPDVDHRGKLASYLRIEERELEAGGLN